jgi:hypothetical protein
MCPSYNPDAAWFDLDLRARGDFVGQHLKQGGLQGGKEIHGMKASVKEGRAYE